MKEAFEKLKERLEEKKKQAHDIHGQQNINDCMLGWESAMAVALYIVSEVESEFENDVCEWKWGIDRAMVQCKGDYIIFESRRLFSFCPYCGKKIKVVE